MAGTPVVLAIDPAILASIRLLGTSAPESALAWLTELDALPNARFALQYGDADVAAQMEAGFETLLEPGALTALMRDEDFTAPVEQQTVEPSEADTPTPTESSSDDTDTDPETLGIPSLEELLSVDASHERVYWPATGTGGSLVADALAEANGDDDASALILTESALVTGTGATVPARASATDTQLLVYDTDISRELNAASAESDTTLRAAPLAAASAVAPGARSRLEPPVCVFWIRKSV